MKPSTPHRLARLVAFALLTLLTSAFLTSLAALGYPAATGNPLVLVSLGSLIGSIVCMYFLALFALFADFDAKDTP